ncbi:GNAT family N-acetyltransferase [bacterium]|nr:GNAT family N-acetyltransferase [bacterium]
MTTIVDLDSDYLDSYCCCFEDYDDRMKLGAERKHEWVERMRPLGLRCKLAIDDDRKPFGMIEYMPIEVAPAEGNGLYFINCIWVHGHKRGLGNRQKRGVGKALLRAAELDAMDLGAQGMAAWGLSLPLWMKAAWFRRHGYRKADRKGLMRLVWKPFISTASPPTWIAGKPNPAIQPGRVTVTGFLNGQCPLMNFRFEQLKRIAAEFEGNVDFIEIDTFDKAALQDNRAKDALFINRQELPPGPPVPDAKLRKRIRKAVRKLGSAPH